MKEKTKIWRKLIIFFIVVSISMFIQNKSLAIENNIVKDEKNIIPKISISKRLRSTLDVTTIDLTGLTTGEEIQEHTCIWTRKYNSELHWQECMICKAKRDQNNHNTTRT